MISCLKDGRGYDREAIEAALRTDARRAEIERRVRSDTETDDYEADSPPSRLTREDLRRELGK
jgi:hypothetical protein